MTLLLALLALSPAAGLAQDAPFRAGFSEVDITPPLGTPRQGWNSKLIGEKVRDPIYARAAAFDVAGGDPVVFVQLDVAMITAADTAAVRGRIRQEHRLDPRLVMVTATHNHAGPAMMNEALPRDESWIATMVERTSAAVGLALAARVEAKAGQGVGRQFDVSFNRRIVMRDGTVRTHGSFKDPDALQFEGPIDPEVGVFAARGKDGKLLGALVTFACHPTHGGGDPVFSAGYPGVVAARLKEKGVPITLYLQGACGNLSHGDPRGRPEKSMEEVGGLLADDAWGAIGALKWMSPKLVAAAVKTVPIPYRKPSKEDLDGTRKGTQRFGEKGYYERKIPPLLEMIEQKGGVEPAELQVFRIDGWAFAAVPAEIFVEIGLKIKTDALPARAWVIGYANGMLGYIPHREAFRRMGYECTFGPPSCMAEEAGDLLAATAVGLIRDLWR